MPRDRGRLPCQRRCWRRLIVWTLAIQICHGLDVNVLVVGLSGEKHSFAREEQAVTVIPVSPLHSIQRLFVTIVDGLD
jgi:hypothetical protein